MELRLTLALLLFALIAPCEAHWRSGPLVGVSGGWVRYSGDYGTDITLANRLTVGIIDNYEHSGATFGLLGGYQFFCQNWIVGLEASIDREPIDKTHAFALSPVANIYSHYSRRGAVALSGRVGYAMAPYFIAYMRAGIEGSRDTFSTTIATATQSVRTPDVAQHAVRFLGGVGAEFPFAYRARLKPLSLRLEYNYHGQCGKLTTDLTPFDSQTSFSGNTRPKIHSLKGALVWVF